MFIITSTCYLVNAMDLLVLLQKRQLPLGLEQGEQNYPKKY